MITKIQQFILQLIFLHDEEEGTLNFGNHKINKSSRDYLLEIFAIKNLADLDGQTYYISAQGYKADNGQLYLDIINIEKK